MSLDRVIERNRAELQRLVDEAAETVDVVSGPTVEVYETDDDSELAVLTLPPPPDPDEYAFIKVTNSWTPTAPNGSKPRTLMAYGWFLEDGDDVMLTWSPRIMRWRGPVLFRVKMRVSSGKL
jgi:hypothetical protein